MILLLVQEGVAQEWLVEKVKENLVVLIIISDVKIVLVQSRGFMECQVTEKKGYADNIFSLGTPLITVFFLI